MSCIPCVQNKELRKQIEAYAEILKTQTHTLGNHGLSEKDFYNSGLFRGAIERVRVQFSATMREKREFVKLILNHLEDCGFVSEWHSAGERNRHDYTIKMSSGKVCVLELKGCLDGNNTNIFERNAPDEYKGQAVNDSVARGVCRQHEIRNTQHRAHQNAGERRTYRGF